MELTKEIQDKYKNITQKGDGKAPIYTAIKRDTNLPVVIKQARKLGNNRKRNQIQEIEMWKKINHIDGINKLYRGIPLEDSYIMIMERWTEDGKELANTLDDYIVHKEVTSTRNIAETRQITKQIVEIAIKMKNENIYHMDIKPTNIIIKMNFMP